MIFLQKDRLLIRNESAGVKSAGDESAEVESAGAELVGVKLTGLNWSATCGAASMPARCQGCHTHPSLQ